MEDNLGVIRGKNLFNELERLRSRVCELKDSNHEQEVQISFAKNLFKYAIGEKQPDDI